MPVGGSIGGGIGPGCLKDGLLGGTTCPDRTDTDGLPADVERVVGVCSIKFRPNYIGAEESAWNINTEQTKYKKELPLIGIVTNVRLQENKLGSGFLFI